MAPRNTTGIHSSGGSLTVRDSVIRNFVLGINFTPSFSNPTQLFVSNTLLSDNSGNGVVIETPGAGTTNGVLDHVQMENNGSHGLLVATSIQTVNVNVTVSDSVSANNGINGIYADSLGGTPVSVMVRNSTVANNGGDGLLAQGTGATIRVTRSTITGNGTGWAVTTGVVLSYGDNNIDGNTSVNTEPPNPHL